MIGVIVEGQGEVSAIKELIGKVDADTRVIGNPLRADMQPRANVLVIARSAKTAVNQLVARGATRIVVLIDREDQPCHVSFARDLRTAFAKIYGGVDFSTVVKNNCIENWLISDLEALKAMPKRFNVQRGLERVIENGRADTVESAIQLLNRCAIGTEYHKGQDPFRIAQRQDLMRVARNSRSFRKFLRELGHRPYMPQSKRPV